MRCGDPVQRLSVSSELTARMSRTLLSVKLTYCINGIPYSGMAEWPPSAPGM